MEEYVTRLEYKEHNLRMEDEHKRMNARLKNLEEESESNNKLLVSIEKMAVSMENMQKEQTSQGKRLEILEKRDGEMWRKVVGDIVKVVISIIVGFIFAKIGIV